MSGWLCASCSGVSTLIPDSQRTQLSTKLASTNGNATTTFIAGTIAMKNQLLWLQLASTLLRQWQLLKDNHGTLMQHTTLMPLTLWKDGTALVSSYACSDSLKKSLPTPCSTTRQKFSTFTTIIAWSTDPHLNKCLISLPLS